jgi:hypothetical protein
MRFSVNNETFQSPSSIAQAQLVVSYCAVSYSGQASPTSKSADRPLAINFQIRIKHAPAMKCWGCRGARATKPLCLGVTFAEIPHLIFVQ